MFDPKLETLRCLATLDDWRNIAVFLDEAVFRDLSPEVTELFTALGVQHESAKDLIRALHCYRIAVWSNALYIKAAPGSEEWQRRWESGSEVRRKFLFAQRELLGRDLHPQASAGEPVTTEEHWREGLAKLVELAKDGAFERAENLLVILDALPDESGDRGISSAGELEYIGDALAGSHTEAARWFYQMASQRFRYWVASASSGGEGLARSAEPDTAAGKLVRLKREAGL